MNNGPFWYSENGPLAIVSNAMRNDNRQNSLPLQQFINLLTKVSCKTLTPEMVISDIQCGAPMNGDGTINLIHYAAWLAARSKD